MPQAVYVNLHPQMRDGIPSVILSPSLECIMSGFVEDLPGQGISGKNQMEIKPFLRVLCTILIYVKAPTLYYEH